jgi:hypothetical protein
MTTSAELSLKGLTDYMEDLVNAGADVDLAAANALVAGGDVLLTGMLEEAPVGESPDDPHPGQLKAHLSRTTPVLDGNRTSVQVGVFDGEYLPEADLARYANAQEHGYTRGGKHYPGKSFVRAGHDKKKRAALAAMKASLVEDGKL